MFSYVSKINGVKRLRVRSLKKDINDNLYGIKKNKKLSSKTTKYINYYFCKKKKVEEKIAFNKEKKKKLEYTPSLFQVIYNIKDDKLLNIKRCNILELSSGDKNKEDKLSIIKNNGENNEVNTEYFSTISNAEVRDSLENKTNLNHAEKNGMYNTTLQKSDMVSIQPCVNIRRDKMLKDLKNMDIINNIMDIKKNNDVCNIYLITSLINIYHENNYNYLILKIIKDMKYILNSMNIKMISLILFNLYKYYLMCYIKKVYEKDDKINFKSHYNMFYTLDHGLNNLNEHESGFLNSNIIKNFLISISYDIKKNLYYETNMSVLSRIIFVYSFFLNKDYKLFELLIERIFSSLKIKREKNGSSISIGRIRIENISLVALSFEKLKLYSSKFTLLHSYILLKKVNRLIKYAEKVLLLNKKKKILKKKNLKHINLFPMHSREKMYIKLPLINLKDIFIYLYIINKNNIKNNRFIISILKYAQIFFKPNFENDKKNHTYSYTQNVSRKKKQINNKTNYLQFYDNSLNSFRDSSNLPSMKNVSNPGKCINTYDIGRINILNSYKSIILKKKKNKKINKMLALYSLYIANKNRQKRLTNFHNNNNDMSMGKVSNSNFIIEKKDINKIELSKNDEDVAKESDKDSLLPFVMANKKILNYYSIDLIGMSIFLNYLINYDYIFMKKFGTFNCLTKLYIDLVRKTNLKEIHFFYLYKMLEINRKLNIYNNFLSKLLYSSIYFKCKKTITNFEKSSCKTKSQIDNLYDHYTFHYLVKTYIELLKSKIVDINLFNSINKCLSIFLENTKICSTNYLTLHKCLKLLYLLNGNNKHIGLEAKNENLNYHERYAFYVITNLEKTNWSTLSNEYVLKLFKYVNNLVKKKKKKKHFQSCDENLAKIEKVYKKLCTTINGRIYNFNFLEMIKLYLYSNYNFRNKIFFSNNFLQKVSQHSNNINDKIQDDNMFVSIFKMTMLEICLNLQRNYKNGRKLAKGVDNVKQCKNWMSVLNLLTLSKEHIKNNINQIKKKNIYVILMQAFFCLTIIFKHNRWARKRWGEISRPNNTKMNCKIMENLFEMIYIILEKGWVCNNDDKNFLIYIFLLYFNKIIIKNKEIKSRFFKKKEGTLFLQTSENYISELNKILNSPLSNSSIAYTNPLLLFFLFKYNTFLINYKNRKSKNQAYSSVSSPILYRNLVSWKNDYKLFRTLYFTIVDNPSILTKYGFTFLCTPWNNLYNHSIEANRHRSTFDLAKHSENNKSTPYYNVKNWNSLVSILQNHYDTNSINILYLFIFRKKEIEHSLKMALMRA
ncbi:conserved Plasmodium protein, unknown function [Plasmodium vinckei brucechwatti]|uniref:Uncharacterized protein n=1 Tax=Plasmodium vinckei brucechwatti TaxID=119398 RepID=A0A6V7S930_PLAVN|nr:conserved Plasmodium protein, unknown function [Plasmodium vinckei brucechwatti]